MLILEISAKLSEIGFELLISVLIFYGLVITILLKTDMSPFKVAGIIE